MTALLREMNNTRKDFMKRGRNIFLEDMICRYEQRCYLDTNENEKILVYLNNKCYNNMNYPSIEKQYKKVRVFEICIGQK